MSAKNPPSDFRVGRESLKERYREYCKIYIGEAILSWARDWGKAAVIVCTSMMFIQSVGRRCTKRWTPKFVSFPTSGGARALKHKRSDNRNFRVKLVNWLGD